jgi:DNA-binding MarR family transcriptional regulator
MHDNSNSSAYELTWLVRRLFRAMAKAADNYLRTFDISAADRAVMEFLFPEQQLSVPQIADRYAVSRQHVQVTVNQLLQREILTASPNPHHKRSSLIGLSDAGRELFAEIQQRDAELVAELFDSVPDKDIQTTRATLRLLMDKLSQGDIDETQT